MYNVMFLRRSLAQLQVCEYIFLSVHLEGLPPPTPPPPPKKKLAKLLDKCLVEHVKIKESKSNLTVANEVRFGINCYVQLITQIIMFIG